MTLGLLTHVCVASPSIKQSVAMHRDLLGATVIREAFDLPAQGVRVRFIDTPNSQSKLIEPLGEGSPIYGLSRQECRRGQHHVCFEVPDIHAKVDLEAEGAKVLGEPRVGAHGMLVIVVHPKDMGGVPAELMETPHADL